MQDMQKEVEAGLLRRVRLQGGRGLRDLRIRTRRGVREIGLACLTKAHELVVQLLLLLALRLDLLLHVLHEGYDLPDRVRLHRGNVRTAHAEHTEEERDMGTRHRVEQHKFSRAIFVNSLLTLCEVLFNTDTDHSQSTGRNGLS